MSSPSPTSSLVFSDQVPDSKSEKIPYLTSQLISSSIPSQQHLSPFTNTTTLHISIPDNPLLRLPLSPSNLTTPIYDSANNLRYASTRPKRRSGTCTLSSPEGGDLIRTTYRLGPGKPPVLRFLKDENININIDVGNRNRNGNGKEDGIQMTSEWTGQSQHFTTPDGNSFSWCYITEAIPPPSSSSSASSTQPPLLILINTTANQRIAQLLRTPFTRNGGLLLVNEEMCGEGGSGMIPEALVVATCLVMLKKEVDRRSHLQAWVPSATIGVGF